MKRALIVVLALLGTVSVASGLSGILLGPEFAPGGGPTTASVDSEYRFTNAFWLAGGIALWWSLRRPGERASTTRVVLAVAFLGGLARLVSVAAVGWPHPVFVGTLALELVVVPVIVWWHVRVFDGARRPGARTPVPDGSA
ncbi:hypothetical protein GCM10009718_19900 [Isoptericola halotolerans]|uniref:DUF4345 domain-containing protein n=1 Tax=Isoptericola halotolerans TaxID=300560 RepID=A0ABX2A757_9MICO|nr:DUF4345 domain-containing protein [Isoptericola halotolerans]NOV98426.1 hypothetical protein [Isoptericola halotolerans]